MSLPFMVGLNAFTGVNASPLFELIGNDSDRVLVLVQLQGGNDGLSTLIPLDQYDGLSQVRSNILLPENDILSLGNSNGFHSAMTGMKQLWEDGQLNIIQGVAYPDQNRSHFRSTDIWNTASEPDEFLTTGWMGRYFDLEHSAYPDNYPNADFTDPFALTVGSIVSETCQGIQSNFSLAVINAFDPGNVNIGEQGESPNNCYGNELDFIRDIARQTNAYSDVIADAANAGNSLSNKYDLESDLANKLQTVARLISGGLKTKLYVVQLGGFDLHAEQVVVDDPSAGKQTENLKELSDAICAFQEDCNLLGISDRVVGMTYSEFGRRIRSNQSYGTDHGTAAPLFVFGSCVNPEIIGENPEIDADVGTDEGVPMQYDFRSVYASLLMDWFGLKQSDIETVLFSEFQHLPIIQGCETISGITEETILSIKLSPNPAEDYTQLELVVETEERLNISLFDVLGSELAVISQRRFSTGKHRIKIELHDYPSGTYFLRIANKVKTKSLKLVKQ